MKVGDKVQVTRKNGEEVIATVEKINKKSVHCGYVFPYKSGTAYECIILK